MTGLIQIPGDHDPRVLGDFIVNLTARLGRHSADAIERRYRLIIRPKPRWWPQSLYTWALRTLLYTEITDGKPDTFYRDLETTMNAPIDDDCPEGCARHATCLDA